MSILYLRNDDRVDAGEIGTGHRVTALYELVLTGADVPSSQTTPVLLDGAAFDGELQLRREELVLVKVR